jgi:CoA:oxalate CoA-transferase
MIEGPLAGVRVVEFSEGLAGPMTARLLGDAGADVIKVEFPEGDRTRGWAPQVQGTGVIFGALNRNKRSIVVDSESVTDLLVLADLADVLIVDQPIVERMSLDLEEIMRTRPELVVCVISGWGPEGPWSDRPGGELPAQLASETTASLGAIGDEPVRIGTDHAGMACALYAMQAITAALLVADTGGQRIDVSLFGSLMHMRTALWVALSNPDEWWGFHLDSYVKPPEQYYSFKDCRAFVTVGRVADIEALVRELKMDFVFDDPRWPLFRQDSAGGMGRYAHVLHDMWDRGLSQWTFDEGAEILTRHGAQVAPCLSFDEFLSDAHVQEMGLVVEVKGDEGDAVSQIRPPWQLTETPASIRAPAPRLDEHGPAIRSDIIDHRHWMAMAAVDQGRRS